MARRLLLLVFVLVLVVVLGAGAAVAAVAATRPGLTDDRGTVDARWAALRAPLAARYESLGRLADALGAAGAGTRSATTELAAELTTWQDLTTRPDPGAEAASANRLEGLVARVRANLAGSARLSRDPGVVAALAVLDTRPVPAAEATAYNRSARRYEVARREPLAQVPARLLGFEARPALADPATGLDTRR
jgi:hypothetical protein